MKEFLLLIAMIFFHIWDDFGRQGILANMKQKEWWKKQEGYNDMYKYDWIPALLAHSFSWTTMISIPVIIYCYIFSVKIRLLCVIIMFVTNVIMHFIVDHGKCNIHAYDLCTNQMYHILLIFASWVAIIQL